ncbi:hypothetical protein PA25_22310 [Pseudoalteromonas sp. A25]|uniref:hypothetical protein n=1 Tax=Pseudoalteromonas sp. A25 TaxID=116092 RepID=UPI00126137D3|nr:hypothetical protein [Pseudoalteromonas sp. A25]BBN82246.1 hypothetical protein PA25_22310 [Pseudoalteromonas sp. A25]
MKRVCLSYFAVVILCCSSFGSFASTNKASVIINKVIEAYGGEKLTHAKAISITDHNKGPWPGESENPGVPEIWRINEALTIDFVNKRKSLLSYRVPRTTIDLEKWIFDGKKGIKYDILHKKYSYEEWVSYHNLGGSVVRSSDTMHAKFLHTDLSEVSYTGDEFYRGKAHYILTATLNSGLKFSYFIEQNSALINKAVRHHPSADLIYVFSNHTQTDGVTYARDMNFFVNGELRLTSVFRDLELNPSITEAFKPLADFKPWGDTFDDTEFSTRQLAEHIYQIGKDRAQTVFIEQANHYIAMGDANELPANFDALKKLTNSDKPLRYFVVTHHHRGNLNGLDNAIALGAKLVVTHAHKKVIENALSQPNSKDNFLIINDRKAFSLGELELFDIATAHSLHYLLVFSPKHKMVIAQEHYETNLVSGKPRIYKDMVIFGNALDALNIEVEQLIDTRSWRTISMDDFSQWVKDFEEKVCPAGYDICANG